MHAQGNAPQATGVPSFDDHLPQWRPARRLENQDRDAAITMHDWNNGPRSLPLADGRLMEVPHARYVRAIDPAGNILPLGIVSNRVDFEDPLYQTLIVSRKRSKGWLFIDEIGPGYDTVEAWHAHLWGEVFKRREAKRLLEERESAHFKDKQEQMLQVASDAATTAATSASASVIKQAMQDLVAAMQSQNGGGRRDK